MFECFVVLLHCALTSNIICTIGYQLDGFTFLVACHCWYVYYIFCMFVLSFFVSNKLSLHKFVTARQTHEIFKRCQARTLWFSWFVSPCLGIVSKIITEKASLFYGDLLSSFNDLMLFPFHWYNYTILISILQFLIMCFKRHNTCSQRCLKSCLEMYWIQIFEIRSEPNVVRYPLAYPAGTGKCDGCSTALHAAAVHKVA